MNLQFFVKSLNLPGVLKGLYILVFLLAGCSSTLPQMQPDYSTATVIPTPTIPPQNDAGSGADATCDFPGITAINPGEVRGSLPTEDGEDCFRLHYNNGEVVNIALTTTEDLELSVALLEKPPIQSTKTGTQTYTVGYAMGHDQKVSNIENTLNLSITRLSGSGEYTITITNTQQNDAGTSNDLPQNNNPAILTAGIYTGFVGYFDACDSFLINTLKRDNILVVKAIPDKTLDVILEWESVREVSPGGTPLPDRREFITNVQNESNQFGAGEPETMTFLVDEAVALTKNDHTTGLIFHYFSVCRVKGTAGEYKLDVTVE